MATIVTVLSAEKPYEGFLGAEVPTPDDAWLSIQNRKPRTNAGKWFDVYPLTGGVACVHQSFIKNSRKATRKDQKRAKMDNTPGAIESIKKLMA